MYESPISIIYNQIESNLNEKIEKDIYEVVQKYGIIVDKEELLKALKYDRDQYQKGYVEGRNREYLNNLEQLKQIKEEINNLSTKIFIGDSYACCGVGDKSAEDFKDEIMKIFDRYISENATK